MCNDRVSAGVRACARTSACRLAMRVTTLLSEPTIVDQQDLVLNVLSQTGTNMNYWLDLFTGTTWREFRDSGAKVSGFSARRLSVAERVKSGDILLCYLTGVMRWVGALEVIGRSTNTDRIWKDREFPV